MGTQRKAVHAQQYSQWIYRIVFALSALPLRISSAFEASLNGSFYKPDFFREFPKLAAKLVD